MGEVGLRLSSDSRSPCTDTVCPALPSNAYRSRSASKNSSFSTRPVTSLFSGNACAVLTLLLSSTSSSTRSTGPTVPLARSAHTACSRPRLAP